MLSVEDWAEIRRLHRAEGLPIKVIARVRGISKNTVKAALACEAPPKYGRAPRGSIVDEAEPRIRELLQAYPTMPATVIAERIGWTRSIRVLSARVAELRPVYLPPDPASRTAYVAGEIAQCDLWFPDVEIPVGFGQTRTATRLPVLTMISAYSRWLLAMLLPSRRAEDLFTGWWELICRLDAVPRALVWDGEGAIGRWRGGRVELTKECQAFRGVLATKVIVCRPADPEAKGLIERSHDYLERSFLPGRIFTSPTDFNAQLTDWLAVVNTRTRRALGCAPTDRIEADRAAMLGLPPVAPATGWCSSLRLPRDHYIRLDGNDYSVHPAAVGRRVLVRADLDRVQAFCDGQTVAEHERIWATYQTISDPVHVEAAKVLRRRRIQIPTPPLESEVPVRDLSSYDTAFGIDLDGGRLMATTKTAPTAARDVTAELAYLTRALKAPTLRDSIVRLAERARAENWTHEEYLAACLQREVSARESHGGEGRIRAARFPARKSLEEFDFDHARGLKRDTIAHLGTLDFVTARDNVVFLGPPGTGKTHLAIGLAMRACQAGHRVLFATAAEWVARLAEAHQAGRIHAELTRLGRYPLIVIDEVGYIPFEPEAANLFFQLVSARYERASLIVTSNKAFGRWGEVFGDDVVAAAMIDRLVHHAEVITLKGDSYRLKDRDLGRTPAAATTTEE